MGPTGLPRTIQAATLEDLEATGRRRRPLDDWLNTLTPVMRTFVLATIAVPIVIYGLMPQLHRLRGRLSRRAGSN